MKLRSKIIFILIMMGLVGIIQANEEEKSSTKKSTKTTVGAVTTKVFDENKEEKEEKRLNVLESAEERQKNQVNESILQDQSIETEPKPFGFNIFNNKSNKFGLPSETVVGKEYVLSAGDVLKVRMFGDTLPLDMITNDADIAVNTSGNISIPVIGSFNARGKSIGDLEKEIMLKGIAKFRDFKLDISLQKMRSLKVFVLGEVVNPGVQVLNPLSNVISAIYSAGGITDTSSLRNVKILRGEKQTVIDLYEYLLEGQAKSTEFSLQEGDTIFIPVIEKKILIKGEVSRPAWYELKNEKILSDVAKLAGGFKTEFDLRDIKITRIDSNKKRIIVEPTNINEEVKNGDRIEVGKVIDEIKNSIIIRGNVYKPGVYEIKTGDSFKALLERTGGYKADTYLKKIDIIRKDGDTKLTKVSFGSEEEVKLLPEDEIYVYSAEEIGDIAYVNIKGAVKEPGTYKVYKNAKVTDLIFLAKGLDETSVFLQKASLFRINKEGGVDIININLEKALTGDKDHNVELKAYDVLTIYTYDNVKSDKNVTIYGEVNSPGEMKYYNNMTLEDLVFLAKSFKESADIEKIEIFRVNKDTREMETLKIDYKTNAKMVIRPDDSVFVRRYEKYPEKKVVKLSGQFKYPGEYVINDNETLNQLIKRAGGFKENAFPIGTKIVRQENVSKIFESMNKRVSVEIETGLTSGTGIKAEELKKDKTEIGNLRYDQKKGMYKNDIHLKNGDEIIVDAEPTTVKILGEVYFPREVGYEDGVEGFDYYVEAAGGYTLKALKQEAFVIKADGKVKKNGVFSKVRVEAGDTIVIPYDPRQKKEFNFIEDTTKILQWLVTIFTAYKLAGN